MTQKPLVLSVETSGRIGSVAIAFGERVLGQTHFSDLMRHSSELFPAISALLQSRGKGSSQIEQTYISVGPGSFTGLRIAVAMAKTMHLANSAKIVAVDTLDVIAANAHDYTRKENARVRKIGTVLDAKRGQFFAAAYRILSRPSESVQFQTGNMYYEKILPDCLTTSSEFLERFAGQSEPIWLLGEGLVYHRDKFKAEGVRFLPEDYWSPSAEKVHLLGWEKAQLGQFADPLTLQPLYLRRPEAEEKWKDKSAKRR
jgi:tRNA threonylcarbamoyladenosine biosynthesis protein TsaB